MLRQSHEPPSLNLGDPELEQQVQLIQKQARSLADTTTAFRSEATRLLMTASQMELLVAVQYACDSAAELPDKIDQMIQRLQNSGPTLLSVNDLQLQLKQAQTQLNSSSGVAREQLQRLTERLHQNLQLVQQGQDVRQSQIANLSMLVTNAAGVLQALQNKLRTANLTDAAQAIELRSLSDDLRSVQLNVDLLISS
jgi:small-conductance mechanosensitive channel